MTLGHYGVKRSINELNSIFSCQWSNGMLPHVRFASLPVLDRPYRPDAADWSVSPAISGETSLPTSGITQPPIVGRCVWQVFHRLDPSTRLYYHDEFCKMALALQRYHNWLFRERDPHHENLVACIHPWETGMDNSPAFAPLLARVHSYLGASGSTLPLLDFRRADTIHVKMAHRPTGRDYVAYLGLLNLFRFHQYNGDAALATTPFLLQDVLFNSILCASIRALASLQEVLARNRKDEEMAPTLREWAASNHIRADQVAGAIRDKLWDGSTGYFYGFDLKSNRLLDTPTVASFAPLLGGIASPEQEDRLVSHLYAAEGFASPVPVPSMPPKHPLFEPVRYWSGPVWPVTNWLISEGLRERRSPAAEQLRRSTVQVIAEGVPLDDVTTLA
ncbi:MAG: trehalase family glycosidase, partial [Chloroflexota bacterium]